MSAAAGPEAQPLPRPQVECICTPENNNIEGYQIEQSRQPQLTSLCSPILWLIIEGAQRFPGLERRPSAMLALVLAGAALLQPMRVARVASPIMATTATTEKPTAATGLSSDFVAGIVKPTGIVRETRYPWIESRALEKKAARVTALKVEGAQVVAQRRVTGLKAEGYAAIARREKLQAVATQAIKVSKLKAEGAQTVARRQQMATALAAAMPVPAAIMNGAAPEGFEWGGVF